MHPTNTQNTLADSTAYKPVLLPTLFSQLNKLFRLRLPSERDLLVWQTLEQKSLNIKPESNQGLFHHKQQAIGAIGVSLVEGTIEPSAVDALLSLIMLVEDFAVFNHRHWFCESLKLIERHHQGGLHGHYFNTEASAESLKQLLAFEGYRTDCFDWGFKDTQQAFLACLQLSQILPWQNILAHLPAANLNEQEDPLKYLYRLKRIAQFIEPLMGNYPDLRQPYLGQAELTQLLNQITLWLNNEFAQMARALGMARPLKQLVLVEGATEELLLPIIANIMGQDFSHKAIGVTGVGGKNQMLDRFMNYTELLSIPVMVLLDKDAENLKQTLEPYKRTQDKILILSSGEIEDLYSTDLVVKTIQRYYTQDIPEIKERLNADKSLVGQLQDLFQYCGLGRFNKAKFAKELGQIMAEEQLVGQPLQQLINAIII